MQSDPIPKTVQEKTVDPFKDEGLHLHIYIILFQDKYRKKIIFSFNLITISKNIFIFKHLNPKYNFEGNLEKISLL